MDDSLLFTSDRVVPDCIRVTMVLPDIFGLASSQRTWLNLHTCTHNHTHTQAFRETQRCSRDPCSQRVFISSLIGNRECGGPTALAHLLSWVFSELSLVLLFFLCLLVCVRNPWNILTLFVSALNTWYWDDQLVYGIGTVLKVSNFVTWH